MSHVSNRNIALIHEFTFRMSSSRVHEVGVGPRGKRQYFEVVEGTVEGSRLSGRLLGTGSDWMLVGEDGFMRMDVRIQIETDDGAVVCAHYSGPAEANGRLERAFASGEPTSFAEQRIRTLWELETGAPRYAWLNRSVFVGEGRFCPSGDGRSGFEHRVYRVDRE